MKFRQLIITNPFQKSRDKKKKVASDKCKGSKDKENPNANSKCLKIVDNKQVEEGHEKGVPYRQNVQYSLNINLSQLREVRSDPYCDVTTVRGNFLNFDPERCPCRAIVPNSCQYLGQSDEDKTDAVPRVRSRIKTNPWIKTPTISSNDIASIAYDCVSGSCIDSQAVRAKPDRSRLNLCIVENTSQLKYRSGKEHFDINLNSVENHYINSDERRNEVNYRWSIISEGDVSIELNSPTIEHLSEQLSSLTDSYNSEYEDNLEFVLEQSSAKCNFTCVSIQDLLSDDADESSVNTSMDQSDDCTSTCSNSAEEDDDRDNCTLMDSSSHGIKRRDEKTDSLDFEVMDSPKTNPSALEESIDAGYASLSRDGKMSESDSDSCSGKLERSRVYFSSTDEDIDLETTITNGDDNNAAKENTEMNFLCATPTGRNLSEVKNSLQEKVNQLRIEKVLVQKKIREAQEEDRIRTNERRKFKSLLTSQKKQTLFKTLSDLKERLENQSMRLQRSYSNILSMQKRFSHRKAPLLLTHQISF